MRYEHCERFLHIWIFHIFISWSYFWTWICYIYYLVPEAKAYRSWHNFECGSTRSKKRPRNIGIDFRRLLFFSLKFRVWVFLFLRTPYFKTQHFGPMVHSSALFFSDYVSIYSSEMSKTFVTNNYKKINTKKNITDKKISNTFYEWSIIRKKKKKTRRERI